MNAAFDPLRNKAAWYPDLEQHRATGSGSNTPHHRGYGGRPGGRRLRAGQTAASSPDAS